MGFRFLGAYNKKAVQNVLKYVILKQVQVDENRYFRQLFFVFLYCNGLSDIK